MTPEQIRQEITSGIDSIDALPWLIRRNIPAERMRLLKAQRAFWQADDGTQLAKLAQFLDREPMRQDGPREGEDVIGEQEGGQ